MPFSLINEIKGSMSYKLVEMPLIISLHKIKKSIVNCVHNVMGRSNFVPKLLYKIIHNIIQRENLTKYHVMYM